MLSTAWDSTIDKIQSEQTNTTRVQDTVRSYYKLTEHSYIFDKK